MFEPMVRASGQQNSLRSGGGLGSYIVKQIVEAHEGRVSMTSSPVYGARFTIHLPPGVGLELEDGQASGGYHRDEPHPRTAGIEWPVWTGRLS